ncbi:DUF1565 domain-containing protein [candidate division KSB1 bacterium]|nr:DUF1565 domain-containing protein [candidate division KSB1 bacterium]
MKATLFGKKCLISTLVISLLFIVRLNAANYYVSTSGSDSNNGSMSAPFKTIQHALDIVSPGDHVIVKAGVYNERLELKTSGSSGNPIVIEGERGPNGEWITVVDGGRPVSGWTTAPEVGAGVYKTQSIDFVPYNMVVNDKQIPQVAESNMTSTEGFRFLGSSVSYTVTTASKDRTVKFWDVFSVIWGYKNGTTYIRFKNGDNPNQKNLRAAPVGAGVLIDNKSHIVIRDFAIKAFDESIIIRGSNSKYVKIENNYIINGRKRIEIVDGASNCKIGNNILSMNFSGYVMPGAWSNNDDNYELGLKEYIYNFYKFYVSDYSGSDDRQVYISGAGENNEVFDNKISQGLIGINAHDTKNLKIYNNEIFYHSSIGIVILDNLVDAEIFDNLIYDNSINLRWHNFNSRTPRSVNIYENCFYLPANVSTHIKLHHDKKLSLSQSWHPTFFVYHNNFSGGVSVLNPGGAYDYGGLRNVHFFNNIFSSKIMVYNREDFIKTESMMGEFDYNWCGGMFYHGMPAWFDSHNIDAEGQQFWDDSNLHDFHIPSNSVVRGAGVDLSKPFTIDGVTFDPLPGMEVGYFSGSQPDIGSPPFSNSDIEPPEDVQSPTVPQDLTYQAVSSSQVDLNWTPSTDNVMVAGYKIFRDGNQVAMTQNTSYSDTGLQEETSYTYHILAYDAAGNESAQSSPVVATTRSAESNIESDLNIKVAPVQVTLDGNLGEFANADSIWFSPPSGGNLATVKAMWNADFLFIGYKVRDTQLNATETTSDGNVWSDDAVEWFIDVNNDGGGESDPNLKYMNSDDFHGMINILNTQYDCCGSSDGTPTKSWDGVWESKVRLDGTLNHNTDNDNGYTIEVRIPWTILGLEAAPAVNSVLAMSFSNEDKDASEFSYVMWPDITNSFQNASNWQPVLLVNDSDDTTSPAAPTGLVVRIID